MKIKFYFAMLFLAFACVSTVTYASFPVQTTTSNVSSVEEKKVELKSPAAASEGKSQIVAAILAFVIGGLGIHRFYLGYTWQGVVQLLTLGGCGIWALIDLVRICIGDLGPKNGSYAKTF